MIDFSQIKEKAQADGVSVTLVLKEQIHLLVLDYLFQRSAFSHLVFQGGTAIRIVYQGVRYSEDLDFVLTRKNSVFLKDLPRLLQGLPSYLDKALPFSREVELKTQKQTPTFQRFALVVGIENLKTKDRTNIEIANVPSYKNETVIIRNESIPVNPAIRVETPKEILGDKFCAFGLREYVKGRDIWDIAFLLQTLNQSVNEEVKRMALRKVVDYHSNQSDFLDRFRKNLSILEERGPAILRTEMEKFLPSAYQKLYREKYPAIAKEIWEVLNDFYGGVKRK